MDATTLKKRFTVLAISVVYRGCAIPVAWKVVGAEEAGSWQPHWLGLLQELEGSVPSDWTVIVMSDRGLYVPWLYAQIVSLGWHPFMRINKQGQFRPIGEATFRSLSTAAPPQRHELVWRRRLLQAGDESVPLYLVSALE